MYHVGHGRKWRVLFVVWDCIGWGWLGLSPPCKTNASARTSQCHLLLLHAFFFHNVLLNSISVLKVITIGNSQSREIRVRTRLSFHFQASTSLMDYRCYKYLYVSIIKLSLYMKKKRIQEILSNTHY